MNIQSQKSDHTVKITGEITARWHDQSKLTYAQRVHNEALLQIDDAIKAFKLEYARKKEALKPWQATLFKYVPFVFPKLWGIKKFLWKNRKFNLMAEYKLGPLVRSDKKYNVICNAGFQAVGEILSGVYGSSGEINYMALGDGAGTPAASDTVLFNEVYRNATASGTVAGNILYLTAFYTESETDGTYTEFGNFIDGTGSADSGQLWTHVNTGGWTKAATEVLIVDCKYTFTSS